jgi:uncharacterized protein (TIGR02266 family)
MSEKRQHLRVPVSLKVAYRTRDALQKDLVTDLSPGGLFIRTSKPLPIGTEVELQVSIAAEEPPIRVRGKVMWLRGENEGMGIQFTGLMGPVLAELVGGEK